MEANQAFQAFRKALHRALTHLHDPHFSASPTLQVLTNHVVDTSSTLRSIIQQEIERLKPAAEVPSASRAHRFYKILNLRYVIGLTQEQTAEQLQMSLRSLQRAQNQAVYRLAHQLWTGYNFDATIVPAATAENMWRSQLDREINLLTAHTPTTPTEISKVLLAVQRITNARTPQRFTLHITGQLQELTISIHAPILQQILLSILDDLIKYTSSDALRLHIEIAEEGTVQITCEGGDPLASPPYDFPLAEGLLASQQGFQLAVTRSHPLTVALSMPLLQSVDRPNRILFVDDNADLADLFATYCIGTNFVLSHLDKGSQVFNWLLSEKPDVIILDVMLPDIDGWELLMELTANPSTATIPVIVCSVVMDPHLALDLGARMYLQKPVWREQFLEAVNQVLHPPAV